AAQAHAPAAQLTALRQDGNHPRRARELEGAEGADARPAARAGRRLDHLGVLEDEEDGRVTVALERGTEVPVHGREAAVEAGDGDADLGRDPVVLDGGVADDGAGLAGVGAGRGRAVDPEAAAGLDLVARRLRGGGNE